MEENNNEEELIEEFNREKKSLKINFIIIAIIMAIVVAVFSSEFTLYYYTKSMLPDKQEASENADENIDIIAKSLRSFRKLIDQEFIGEIDEQKILDQTIKGYVNGLDDEYTEYMTKEEWEEFQSSALGNYVGVGIYMGVDKNDNIVVLMPMEESPALKAGIKSGDIIVSVNDENAIGVSSDIVSSMIKGEEGTSVKLTVLRGTEYLDFDLKREAIKIYHVGHEMLENNIGYISLLTFDENCSVEFQKALEDLKAQNAQKIIIDLRNNTGGLVEEALNIADMIIPKGENILITVDAKGNKEYSKAEKDPIVNCDIVVLVNEYSASASEILVGALKDTI